MAGVEGYKSRAQTEALPTPFQSPSVSPDAAGASIGQGLEQLAGAGQDLAQVHAGEVRRQSAIRVMKTVGEFGQAADQLLHDPKSGVLNLQGEQALGAYEPTATALQKLQAQWADKLTPEQRELFNEHATGLVRTAIRQVDTHAGRERQKLEVETLGVTQGSMLDSSVKAIDQISADSYTEKGAEATRAWWLQHADHTVADAKAREFTEKANAARLDRLLSDPMGTDEARRFFQARRDALPATMVDDFQKKVEAAGVDEMGYAVAKKISDLSIAGTGQMDRGKAQALLDKAQMPIAVREKAQAFLDHRNAVLNEAWRDEASNLAADVVNAGVDPNTGRFSADLVPGPKMAELERRWPQKAAELKKSSAVNARQQTVQEQKEQYAEDIGRYFGDDWQATARMSQKEFLTEIGTRDPAHRTALIERFSSLQKRLDFAPPESVVLDETRKALGVGKTVKVGQLTPEKKQAFAAIQDAVRSDVREWIVQNKGAHPANADVRKMVQARIVADSGLFSTKYRVDTSPRVAPAEEPSVKAATPAELTLPLPAAPAASPAKVRVIAPNGKPGLIPADQLDAALKKGFRRG